LPGVGGPDALVGLALSAQFESNEANIGQRQDRG
jgi:hypothetical protein